MKPARPPPVRLESLSQNSGFLFYKPGGPRPRISGQLREQKRYYKRSLGERSRERVTVKKRSCHFKLQTCSPKPTQKEVYRTKQVGNSNKKGQKAPAVVADGDYQERHKASKAPETRALKEEGRQTKDARCLRKRRARREEGSGPPVLGLRLPSPPKRALSWSVAAREPG